MMKIKTILFSILSILVSFATVAQQTIKPSEIDYPFSADILHYKLSSAMNGNASASEIIKREAYFIKGDSVFIEMRAIGNQRPDYELVNQFGGNIKHTYKNWASGYIHIDDLLLLDEKIQTNDFISMVHNTKEMDNEGPSVMNSASYNGSGNAGQGIKIAIIDAGYAEWDLAQASTPGCLPSSYTFIDCTSGTCVEDVADTGTSTHGRACTQVVFDHAPAATYYTIKTNGSSQKAAAIAFADSINVDIISMSLSSYNTGWADDSGVVCDGANDALANDDVLIFVSAGNRNGTHYQALWSDINGNNAHNYAGGDESNDITLAPGASFSVSLQWSGTLSASNDLDLLAIDVSSGNVVESSLNTDAYEFVSVTNNTGATNTYGVRIINSGTTTPNFEYWNSSSATNFEYTSTGNSTTSPANSSEPNVMAVSAVRWEDFGTDSSVTIPAASIGPTNGGAASVDITGPTGCTTNRSDGSTNRFGFTSGSTPNVAGATAAFWSKHPTLSANEVRQIILLKASIYEDLATPGFDHNTGHGGLHLFDYSSKNVYVDQGAGVFGVAPSNGIYPWDNVKDVNSFAPTDRNVFMLTGDSNAAPVVLTKKMLLTSGSVTGKVIY